MFMGLLAQEMVNTASSDIVKSSGALVFKNALTAKVDQITHGHTLWIFFIFFAWILKWINGWMDGWLRQSRYCALLSWGAAPCLLSTHPSKYQRITFHTRVFIKTNLVIPPLSSLSPSLGTFLVSCLLCSLVGNRSFCSSAN